MNILESSSCTGRQSKKKIWLVVASKYESWILGQGYGCLLLYTNPGCTRDSPGNSETLGQGYSCVLNNPGML